MLGVGSNIDSLLVKVIDEESIINGKFYEKVNEMTVYGSLKMANWTARKVIIFICYRLM
jgi:hypothetical protein